MEEKNRFDCKMKMELTQSKKKIHKNHFNGIYINTHRKRWAFRFFLKIEFISKNGHESRHRSRLNLHKKLKDLEFVLKKFTFCVLKSTPKYVSLFSGIIVSGFCFILTTTTKNVLYKKKLIEIKINYFITIINSTLCVSASPPVLFRHKQMNSERENEKPKSKSIV